MPLGLEYRETQYFIGINSTGHIYDIDHGINIVATGHKNGGEVDISNNLIGRQGYCQLHSILKGDGTTITENFTGKLATLPIKISSKRIRK